MRSRVAIPVAVALVLLAAVLSLLAREIGRWESSMHRDDIAFLTAPRDAGLWKGPPGPGGRLAGRMLGLADDVRFREGERLYVVGRIPAATFTEEKERLAARGGAIEQLEQIATSDPEPWRRARAANLLGVLLVEDAREGGDPAPALSKRAVAAFTSGAREEAGGDEPRFNLELVLTLLRPDGGIGRDVTKRDIGGSTGRGAGVALPEEGY